MPPELQFSSPQKMFNFISQMSNYNHFRHTSFKFGRGLQKI